MATSTTNSGIATDTNSGERHIPESVRADDVEVYKNRPAEAFRDRSKRIGIPGAAGLNDEPSESSASSNKNAKRREARKKAKATTGDEETKPDSTKQQEEAVDPEVEREKKARNLKKKLKQAKDLKMKKDGGEGLLPEQIAKVIKINELIRELDALGFDAEGEPKDKDADPSAEGGEENK
ncbi:hypothetical protein PT974_11448 [Cladobotryum mycophilum]|uniref:WIBG Mago-binding domain-containing protein n=1 Tax=Cladobotryum mycophilum TaxID=491253 RepID=A0ABR0S581_9HYPO